MDVLKKWRETVLHAIEGQGITQKEIAAKVGITQGMLSQALGGKAQMSEERRRMVCEVLGMDYDEIMGYKVPAETLHVVMDTPKPDTTEAEPQPDSTPQAGNEALHGMGILCAYAEGKIIEDIDRGGWKPDLGKLRELLDAVCDLRKITDNAE